jgi:hypothetical protein
MEKDPKNRVWHSLDPLVDWKNTPAALFRTSAPFPPAKSVVFAGCRSIG